MKLRLLAATLAALSLSSGIALAQTTPVAKPAATPAAKPAPAPAAADKTTLSYALGYDYGANLVESKADLDIATITRALQDGFAKRAPTMPGDKLAAALQEFQKKMAAQQRAEFERMGSENKTKSEAFLAANRAKPGVTALPSGVQYRVIETGTGAKPTAASTVQVHLKGSISTGQEFANTYSAADAKPVSFKLGDFPLAGMKEVLVMMPMGSHWEVAIPADKAYGNDPRSPIGPNQAILFDLKLVSVK